MNGCINYLKHAMGSEKGKSPRVNTEWIVLMDEMETLMEE